MLGIFPLQESCMSAAATTGEEFREDRHKLAPLPADVLWRLTNLNPWRSLLAVMTTVLTLVATITVALVWWTPWVVIPAVFVVAAQQQACFVLAHDAAHYRLFASRWLNDWVGRAFASVVGISMCSYRVVHRLHHNHLYQTSDPDIALIAGYPRGRAYLLRKLRNDICGLTAPKTYAYFFGAPAINDDVQDPNRPLNDTSPKLRRAARDDRWTVVALHLGALATAIATGYAAQYLILWVLPACTVLQAILRFRAICEHGAIVDRSSPLTAARTNYVPWWLRWLFPHHVNYHVEHHLYPAIPHYRLAECHRALREQGVLEHAEVRRFSETVGLLVAPRAV
ncbi:MAG: fatty acid desaturase [Gammaproteobacteria bacterium]|jgi:fatty acid desaturase